MGPEQVLDRLVADGDPGGAVAVVRAGVVEVDHAAGTARGDGTPYASDTLVMTWSVAKPFAALAALSAVAEGHLALDTRVADLWPAHGKDATTLRHLLAHQAGLPVFPEAAAGVPHDDRDALVALLADAVPAHPPGAAVAEHALTYGHLLDEVVRRATGEPLADRFARLAGAGGWDLHLVVPEADLDRVADVVALDPETWPSAYLDDPRWGPALGRPAGLLEPDLLNSRAWRRNAFPAVALHASALGLARFYDDLLRPDGVTATLLGADLWAAYTSPAASGHDLVLDRPVTWTLGFQVDEEPTGDGGTYREVGMGGAGGCSAWAAPDHGYGAAYLTRGLGGHDRGEQVWSAVCGAYAAFRP